MCSHQRTILIELEKMYFLSTTAEGKKWLSESQRGKSDTQLKTITLNSPQPNLLHQSSLLHSPTQKNYRQKLSGTYRQIVNNALYANNRKLTHVTGNKTKTTPNSDISL